METIEHTFKETLKKATSADLTFKHQEKTFWNIGAVYFLKSKRTGLVEGPYLVSKDTDIESLKMYLENEMVWVRG